MYENNLNLESKYFNEYYGNNPDFYSISFIHDNIEIFDNSEKEYKLIELDLKKVKEYTKELFKIYFSDFDTFADILKNTQILNDYFDNIYLRINSKNDIEKLKKYDNLSNLNIIILYNDFDIYKSTDINKYRIILQIDTVNELSPERLYELKEEFNISEIIVGQICYLSSYFMDYFKIIGKKFNIDYLDQLNIEKRALISNDNYSIDTYTKIYSELSKLTQGIDINDTDVNKLKVIYDRIINEIYYDFSGVKESKLFNQNLIGGLLYNTCVCEGYAKILQQALSLVGIESIVVGGGGKKEEGGHIWNQVKINDIWYNVDATYDSNQVHENKPISLFLVDDKTLYYKTEYPIGKKCNHKFHL